MKEQNVKIIYMNADGSLGRFDVRTSDELAVVVSDLRDRKKSVVELVPVNEIDEKYLSPLFN